MNKKILLVDDHVAYSSVLAASLKIHGFEVTSTQDGSDVVRLAESQKPDLILLDIMMPKMGGTEVRSELLKHPFTKNIPTIYLTGLRPPRYSRPEGVKSRPVGVRTVGKSDDLKELLDAIRETLSA